MVGVKDSLKGQVPLGLVVLKSGVEAGGDDRAGAHRHGARPHRAGRRLQGCKVVARLPKTRSGKILRATLRKIADGEDYVVPPTIDDPVILEEIGEVLKGAMR